MDVLTLLLLLTPALVSSAYEVQQEEITFYLYTRDQPEQQITLEDIQVVDTSKDLRFIIHGWIAAHNETWVTQLTEAYLKAGDFNVIQVDWSQLAAQVADVAVAHAEEVAFYVANLIAKFVKDLGIAPENVEIVGHSLGAHISGFVGRYVKGEFGGRGIGKIIAMDPPNLVFEGKEGLQKDDAGVVVVVHTDSSKLEAFGSVDFYPNGGFAPQPGCPLDSNCSHVIVTAFVIEAIENPTAFLAVKCDCYESYVNGNCKTNDTVSLGANLMGKEGSYFFETNPEKPYSKN